MNGKRAGGDGLRRSPGAGARGHGCPDAGQATPSEGCTMMARGRGAMVDRLEARIRLRRCRAAALAGFLLSALPAAADQVGGTVTASGVPVPYARVILF